MEQFNSSINDVFSVGSRFVSQGIDYLGGIAVNAVPENHGATTFVKEEESVDIKDEFFLETSRGSSLMSPGMIDVGMVAATEEVETMYDSNWNNTLPSGTDVGIQFSGTHTLYTLDEPVTSEVAPRGPKVIKMLKVPKMLKIPSLLKLPNYPMMSGFSTAGHQAEEQKSLEMVAHLLCVDKPGGNGKVVRVWQCGVCRREFFNRYTLVRHMPTHTDERHFMCDTCGKAFRQASTLAQHRAIHSNARPYVCPQCQKSFNRASSLISHRKTHATVKQHVCKFCGKGFHQKGNLRNHEFTHTDARPYVCDLCGKGFNQRSNLVCHKDRLHKMEPTKFIFGL